MRRTSLFSLSALAPSNKSVSRATLTMRFRANAGADAPAAANAYFLLRQPAAPAGAAYATPRHVAGVSDLYVESRIADGGAVAARAVPLSKPIEIGRGYSAKLEMFLATTATTTKAVRLYLDGFEVASDPLDDRFSPGPVEASLGIPSHAGDPGASADFDDVLIEFSE